MLIGRWEMDGGLADIFGDLHGINNGGVFVQGLRKRAISFDGSSTYARVLNNSRLEPEEITISAWINIDNDANITLRHIFLCKWLGYSFELQAGTMQPYLRINTSGGTCDSPRGSALSLGEWHHLVGSFKVGVGSTLYVDGVLVGTTASSNNISYSSAVDNGNLNIGRYAGGVYFKGKVEDVRIYNYALNVEQVKSIYQNYKGIVELPDKIRYIRDWVNGSNTNPNSHWVEVRAIDFNDFNIALNKTVTSLNTVSYGTIDRITDGDISVANYVRAGSETISNIQVDLGNLYEVKEVQVWHYYDGRKYYDTRTEVSADGVNWYIIFDSDESGIYSEVVGGEISKVGRVIARFDKGNLLLKGELQARLPKVHDTQVIDISSAGGTAVDRVNKKFVKIDGVTRLTNNIGIGLVRLNEYGSFVDANVFDVYNVDLNATKLSNLINSTPDGYTLIFNTYDEPFTHSVGALSDTLSKLGFTKLGWNFRCAWLGIVRKGIKVPLCEELIAGDTVDTWLIKSIEIDKGVTYFPFDNELRSHNGVYPCDYSTYIYSDGTNIVDRYGGATGVSTSNVLAEYNIEKTDYAMKFTGAVDSWIKLNKDFFHGATNFRVEVGFLINSIISLSSIFHLSSSGNNELDFIVRANGSVYLDYKNVIKELFLPGAVVVGKPYNAVIERVDGVITAYLNGSRGGSFSDNVSLSVTSAVLGQDQDADYGGFDATQSLNGYITYFRFSKENSASIVLKEDGVVIEQPLNNYVLINGWTTSGEKGIEVPEDCPEKPYITSHVSMGDWKPLLSVSLGSKILSNGKSIFISGWFYCKNEKGGFNCQLGISTDPNISIGTMSAVRGWNYLVWSYTNSTGANLLVTTLRIEAMTTTYTNYWVGGDNEAWGCNYVIQWDSEYSNNYINYSNKGVGVVTLPRSLMSMTEGSIIFKYVPKSVNTYGNYPVIFSMNWWTSPITRDWVGIYRGSGWSTANTVTWGVYDSSLVTSASDVLSGINARIGHEIYLGVGWSVLNSKVRFFAYDLTTNELLKSVEFGITLDGFSKIDSVRLGGLTPYSDCQNAKFSDLSFYNRFLELSELSDYCKKSLLVSKDGDLVINSIEEGLDLGNGKDGDLVVNGVDTIINSYDYVVEDLVNNTTTVSVEDASGFSIGDEILIIQMQYGKKAECGDYEFARIKAINGLNLELQFPIQGLYYSGAYDVVNNSKVTQVVKVPNYSSVTINAGMSITCGTWDGKKGGIIVFRCLGDIINNGEITANGKGFRGGRVSSQDGYVDANGDGECGEGIRGRGVSGFYSGVKPIAVDGGGITYVYGAGGSYGTQGDLGVVFNSAYTPPKSFTYGDMSLTRLLLGSGGGGGHNNSGYPHGGNGGGIINIFSKSINGVINCKGQDAYFNTTTGLWGAGGGSGGSVYIEAEACTSTINVDGGVGATGTNGRGGNGGKGRYRVFIKEGLDVEMRADTSKLMIRDIVRETGL